MALVEMKKLRLVAVMADRKRLLRALQKLGCVQIEPLTGEDMQRYHIEDGGELERAEQTLSRLNWAIGRLSRLDTSKKGLLAPRDTAGDEEIAAAWAAMGQALETIDALEQIERAHAEARAEESRAQSRLRQLAPYRELSEPLEKLGRSRLTMSMLGVVDPRRVDELNAGIQEQKLAGRFDVVSIDKDGAHIFVLSPLDEWDAFWTLLKESDFTQENFEGFTGTPRENMTALEKRVDELRASHAQLDDKARGLCDQLPRLKLLYDVLSLERDRDKAATLLAGTHSAFMLTGWVPENAVEAVGKRLREVSPSCVVEFTEPEPDDKPPTVMQNNRFLKPYQSIIAMYSLPDYHGIDPTFMMTPFFICFFGMMVSDAGYGLVMGVIAALAVKFLKLRGTIGDIAKILVAGGASTLFWGILYGGWFGVTVPALMFSPMDEPLNMMILCVVLGLVQIVTSLVIAMYMNIKRGKPLDALYDQGSWIAVLLGWACWRYSRCRDRQVAGDSGRGGGRAVRRPAEQEHTQAHRRRPGQALRHIGIPERPAVVCATVRHGACDRRNRHGHKPGGGHAVGEPNYDDICGAGVRGRTRVQPGDKRAGRVRAFVPAPVHRVLLAVL